MFARSVRFFPQRFASTLAFIEHNGSQILPSSFSALAAAHQLGNPVIGVLCGKEPQEASKAAKKLPILSKLLTITNNQYDHYPSEPTSALLAHLITNNDVSHLVAAASTVGKDLVPRVGGLLDIQPITDITKIVSPQEFTRPVYAGNSFETVKSNQKINLITIRSSAFSQEIANSDRSCEVIETKAPEFTHPKCTFISEELVQSERPELDSAKIVISGGRGLKTKEDFERLMYPLADKLGAAVGASRAVVDDGFCDNSLQVGQTGKVVAPELYIALGISGAIQHLAGMKDSKVIAAIDKNAEAPIFQVADIGLEADVFEVIPKLIEQL